MFVSWAHFHDQIAYFIVYLLETRYLLHANNYGHAISPVLQKSVLQKLNNGYLIMKMLTLCVCLCELFYSELSCPPKKDISCVAEDESNVIMSITSLTADNATECGGESKLINITKICRIGMFFACRPVY